MYGILKSIIEIIYLLVIYYRYSLSTIQIIRFITYIFRNPWKALKVVINTFYYLYFPVKRVCHKRRKNDSVNDSFQTISITCDSRLTNYCHSHS